MMRARGCADRRRHPRCPSPRPLRSKLVQTASQQLFGALCRRREGYWFPTMAESSGAETTTPDRQRRRATNASYASRGCASSWAGRTSAHCPASFSSSSSFAITARGTGMFAADGVLNWSTVSGYLMIIAVGAALLMIGGEFDLSLGSMIGFCRHDDRAADDHLPCADHAQRPPRLRRRAHDRFPQRAHRRPHPPPLVHRDARLALHLARADAGAVDPLYQSHDRGRGEGGGGRHFRRLSLLGHDRRFLFRLACRPRRHRASAERRSERQRRPDADRLGARDRVRRPHRPHQDESRELDLRLRRRRHMRRAASACRSRG